MSIQESVLVALVLLVVGGWLVFGHPRRRRRPAVVGGLTLWAAAVAFICWTLAA